MGERGCGGGDGRREIRENEARVIRMSYLDV